MHISTLFASPSEIVAQTIKRNLIKLHPVNLWPYGVLSVRNVNREIYAVEFATEIEFKDCEKRREIMQDALTEYFAFCTAQNAKKTEE